MFRCKPYFFVILSLIQICCSAYAEEEKVPPPKTDGRLAKEKRSRETQKGIVDATNTVLPMRKNGDEQQSASDAGAGKIESPTLTTDTIHELETRQSALENREKALNERARALDVQEKILSEKLRKMEQLNQKMADRLDAYKKEHEDRVTNLVNMLEAMKPQAAAQYVENLDANLAVEVLSRLQIAKAAKILNLVDKKKSARLSEMYTGYREGVEEETKPAKN